MRHFLLLMLLLTNSLFADWFDFFSWGNSKASQFNCPYQCGQFGSSSLKEVEKDLFDALSGIFEVDDYDFELDPYMQFSFSEFMTFQNAYWIVTADSGGHIFERYLTGNDSEYLERVFTLNIPWSIHDAKVSMSECLYCIEEGGKVGLRKGLSSPVLGDTGTYKTDRVSSFLEMLRLLESDALACCMVEFRVSNKALLNKEAIKDKRLKIKFHQRQIEKFGTHLIKDSVNNIIDLNQEIETLERSIKFYEKEFEKLFAQESQAPIRERRWRDQRRTSHLLLIIDRAHTNYSNIHKKCAEKHQAPSAFYTLALMHFHEGDHMRALESLDQVFNHIDLETLEAHQASHVCQAKGAIENQLALYEAAILSLGQAIDKNILVRVMPGDPSSPNPMQKKPYVIQRIGDKAVSKEGKLIGRKEIEAHIPLDDFEFKGW
ncbi:MAG: hypothetical protein KDK56_07315 [Simkania sp.]|nr:hypothetical protein [Simkania sp.]MCP5489491.1 hypothetical protein [Chlamydiales bacterium]